MNLIYVSSLEEKFQKLGEILKTSSKAAIEASNIFRIGLSGGSAADYFIQTLKLIHDEVELDKWRFFLCDERYVSEDSQDSNYGFYREHLLTPDSSFYISSLKEDQFLRLDSSLPLDECARDYEKRLRNEFQDQALGEKDSTFIPVFDLLLLGMGLDGHTCSLFPGHKLLTADNSILIGALENSPKSPPKRITMTLPLLNASKEVIFLISGKEKSQFLKNQLKNIGDESCPSPALMVKPNGSPPTALILEC